MVEQLLCKCLKTFYHSDKLCVLSLLPVVVIHHNVIVNGSVDETLVTWSSTPTSQINLLHYWRWCSGLVCYVWCVVPQTNCLDVMFVLNLQIVTLKMKLKTTSGLTNLVTHHLEHHTQLNEKKHQLWCTVRILNFVVYEISWISWYASDPRKFHRTIVETHVAPSAYTKFNTLILSNYENFTHKI